VRLLFITMLAVCDAQGRVYGSRGGLLRLANVKCNPDEADPFEILMAPDNDSSDLLRNPEQQGRRIEEIPGGFAILNYDYYRNLNSEDDRREQNREAQARFRSKHKQGVSNSKQGKQTSANVTNGQHGSAQSAQAEAEAEAEALKPSAVSLEGRPPPADPKLFVNDYDEAKRLICERCLNHKDPNRLWSVQADQDLLKHLPIPRLEIERVAWFLSLPNDGSPELEARRTKTETGLMAFWGDEVTRANAFWQKLNGWREKERAAG
jgi:hypothetical protein